MASVDIHSEFLTSQTILQLSIVFCCLNCWTYRKSPFLEIMELGPWGVGEYSLNLCSVCLWGCWYKLWMIPNYILNSALYQQFEHKIEIYIFEWQSCYWWLWDVLILWTTDT
jgi:hypothetical protein